MKCTVEMLKTFSVTAGLPSSPWRTRRAESKSGKERRKGACLSDCQPANKSQSSANTFSSPAHLALPEDTATCTQKNSRRWKQSRRPLCLTAEEEKGRGETPWLWGFNRHRHRGVPAVSPIYPRACHVSICTLRCHPGWPVDICTWQRPKESWGTPGCPISITVPNTRWGKKPCTTASQTKMPPPFLLLVG